MIYDIDDLKEKLKDPIIDHQIKLNIGKSINKIPIINKVSHEHIYRMQINFFYNDISNEYEVSDLYLEYWPFDKENKDLYTKISEDLKIRLKSKKRNK